MMPPTMSAGEMFAIRDRLGLTRVEFGKQLGYDKNNHVTHQLVRDYETGEKEIPLWISTAVRVADVGGIADFIRSHHDAKDIAEFSWMLSRYLRGFK